MGFYEAVLISVMTAATPLVLAAIGELVVERSGVLNLGVEGMMIMGAVCAFAGAQMSGSALVGVVCGMIAGGAFSLLFGFLTLTLVANQVATGLALTILGLGLSGMIGESFIGLPGVRLPVLDIPVLSDIPVIGRIVFGQDLLFYASIGLVIGVAWFLFRTRAGLRLRAIGDNHGSAHALGVSVIRVRYLAVLFGGVCSGLAGAHLSLVYTPQWRWWSLLPGGRFVFLPVPISSALSPSADCMPKHLVSAFPRSSYRCFPISLRSSFSS
jgi:general nucleoside transport system permease protein